jgi:tetratricopeptide (TPR) repeat protein
MENHLLEQAENARHAGKYREALRYFQDVLSSQPESTIALGGAAYCLYNLKRDDEAAEICRRALSVDPNLVLPHIVLAYICSTHHEKEKSCAEISMALRIESNSAEALCCNGILLLEDEKIDDAIEFLVRAIGVNPEMYLAHYNLIVCYQKKGLLKKYKEEIFIIFRLKPNLVNLIRLLVAFLLTNRVLLTAILVIPLASLIVKLKVLLVLHLLLILVYFSAGILMIREKQQRIAIGNFAMALLITLADVLILVNL